MENTKKNNLRQFHPHEHSASKKGDQDAHKTKEQQQESVEFGHVLGIRLVQDDETKPTHGE